MPVPDRGITDVLLRSGARANWSGPKICPVCIFKNPRQENVMKPRFSTLGHHKNLFYVDNVTMKCRTCKLLLTFGVPISKADYETELEERKKLGLGKSVGAELEDSFMWERLRVLGYLSEAEEPG